MLHELQSRFRRAATGRDDAPLAGLLAADMPGGISVARRIAVHRNTYFGSLIEALAAAYPVVEQLVGGAFFAAAARRHIESAPPPRPDLASYGGGFGDFLDGFRPAAGLPFLGDMARLEWARVDATFAAEAEPLDPAALANLAPETIPALCFTLHPSARLTESPWAVQSVWDAHQSDPPGVFDPAAGPERVLLVRPADRMQTLRLTAGEAALLRVLRDGRTLGDAAGDALATEPNLDLQGFLARLFTMGAFADTCPDDRRF